MKALYAALLGVTLMACASVQPAKVEAGDRCLRCRRPIQDLRLAGEIIDNMRAPFPFRSPACMAKYIKANKDLQLTAIFVTDFRTGKMIPASDAWFVPTSVTSEDGRSAEADYYAFRTRSEAREFKADTTKFMRWSQVVAAVTD